MGISALLGAINAGFIEFFDLDASRTMDDALRVDYYTYMGDGHWLLAVGCWLFMSEENEVSGLRLTQMLDDASLRDLLGRIARQRDAEQAQYDLREARAVHAHSVLAAP